MHDSYHPDTIKTELIFDSIPKGTGVKSKIYFFNRVNHILYFQDVVPIRDLCFAPPNHIKTSANLINFKLRRIITYRFQHPLCL